jgi:hypothetical protein
MTELERFLLYLRGEGWGKLEAHFYNASEDDWVEIALQSFYEYESKEEK